MININSQIFKDKKVALVLSGGVVKAGAWHIGVAQALEEAGFSFKNYNSPDKFKISTFVGSSAGSFINVLLASGFSSQDIMNAALGIDTKELSPIRYRDIFSMKRRVKPTNSQYFPFTRLPFYLRRLTKPLLKINGFFSTEGLAQYLKDNIPSDDFDSLRSDLFIVTSALDSSHKTIFTNSSTTDRIQNETTVALSGTPISEACAASMSIPAVFSPYPITIEGNEHPDYFFDGEIRDTLSNHIAIDNNCDVIISSWIHTPYHFHKEVGSLINLGLPAICLQAIYQMIQNKIVSAKSRYYSAVDAISAVNDFLINENFSSTKRQELIKLLENKLAVKSHIKFIDICPDDNDYEVFFSGHFSLNSNAVKKTADDGYKKTINVLRGL